MYPNKAALYPCFSLLSIVMMEQKFITPAKAPVVHEDGEREHVYCVDMLQATPVLRSGFCTRLWLWQGRQSTRELMAGEQRVPFQQPGVPGELSVS